MKSKFKDLFVDQDLDSKTKKRIQKIIDETRAFIQEQGERGIDVVEISQVMIAMSRETLVDVYGEDVADSYITHQISYLKSQENSLTLH